jgi:hypothetical protein
MEGNSKKYEKVFTNFKNQGLTTVVLPRDP